MCVRVCAFVCVCVCTHITQTHVCVEGGGVRVCAFVCVCVLSKAHNLASFLLLRSCVIVCARASFGTGLGLILLIGKSETYYSFSESL